VRQRAAEVGRLLASGHARLPGVCVNVSQVCMAIGLWWDDARGGYIRLRSSRYPGATDIDPAWTLEAAADLHRITRDPDPKSQWETSGSSATRPLRVS
jgi:hypothetical protein